MKENSTKTESADAPEDSARAKAWEKAYDSLSPDEKLTLARYTKPGEVWIHRFSRARGEIVHNAFRGIVLERPGEQPKRVKPSYSAISCFLVTRTPI